MQVRFYAYHFNPRSPHGERRAVVLRAIIFFPISTHAPRTGSDVTEHFAKLRAFISTHAPRTGSDLYGRFVYRAASNFNPRSPHGERRYSGKHQLRQQHFNPRSPHGERRVSVTRSPTPQAAFQPTLPARGATRNAVHDKSDNFISTHAPRTGSDNSRSL